MKDDYWALMNSLFVVGLLTTLAFVLAVSYALPRFAGTFMGVDQGVGRGSKQGLAPTAELPGAPGQAS